MRARSRPLDPPPNHIPDSIAVGSWQLATGSRQLATGNWQLAVGSWQVAGFRYCNRAQKPAKIRQPTVNVGSLAGHVFVKNVVCYYVVLDMVFLWLGSILGRFLNPNLGPKASKNCVQEQLLETL